MRASPVDSSDTLGSNWKTAVEVRPEGVFTRVAVAGAQGVETPERGSRGSASEARDRAVPRERLVDVRRIAIIFHGASTRGVHSERL